MVFATLEVLTEEETALVLAETTGESLEVSDGDVVSGVGVALVDGEEDEDEGEGEDEEEEDCDECPYVESVGFALHDSPPEG